MPPDACEFPSGDLLFNDVTALIDGARTRAASAINSELVTLYWSIGKRIREDILGGERAAYGQAVVQRLAEQLTQRYGRGYSRQNLERMCRFAEWLQHMEICSTLSVKLTWSHVIELLTIIDPLARQFYMTYAACERWSVRALRSQVAGKLYERTIKARGDVNGLEIELAALRDTGAAPSLVFREPYVLDFLGLPALHSESELEGCLGSD